MEKMQLLENSLMELGTELYRLKSELKSVTDFNTRLVKTLSGLKAMLDEKGLVPADDFDAASELNDIMNALQTAQTQDGEAGRIKKQIH